MEHLRRFGLWLVALSVAGCGVVEPGQTAAPPNTAPPVATTTPARTPTASSSPSRSPRSSPTPSPTAPPTLTDEDRFARVRELSTTNGGCELPCFWGITPGETTWGQAEEALHEIGVKTSSQELQGGAVLHGASGLDFFEKGLTIYLDFWETDSQIRRTSVVANSYRTPVIFRSHWHWYLLGPVLGRLGPPNRIQFLGMVPHEASSATGYTISLDYDDLGMSIIYTGVTPNLPVFQICPASTFVEVHISVQFPADAPPEPTATPQPYAGPGPLPIQEVTSLSLEEFVERFAGEDNRSCFTTPREIWE